MTDHRRLTKIAGRILTLDPRDLFTYGNTRCPTWITDRQDNSPAVSWEDIRSLASYVRHHTEDHSDREAQRKGRIPKGHVLVKRHKPIVRNHKARQGRK